MLKDNAFLRVNVLYPPGSDILYKPEDGKRAVVEPERKLTAEELISRVCDYFGCEHFEHLKQNVSRNCTRYSNDPTDKAVDADLDGISNERSYNLL